MRDDDEAAPRRAVRARAGDAPDLARPRTPAHDIDAWLRLGVEQSAVGLAVTDTVHRFEWVNAALSALLRVPEAQLVGRALHEFLVDGAVPLPQPPSNEPADPGSDHSSAEHRVARGDGQLRWVAIDETVIRDDDGRAECSLVQVRDITQRKRAEAALEHQALHDDLTGLPNRLLLLDRLEQALLRARSGSGQLAVLFIDLDRFKVVNDGLGHAGGDELLVEVAKRIVSATRPSDTIARFGGDEFVVVCERVNGVAEARVIGTRIGALLDDPIAVRGRLLQATVSIGIALDDGTTPADELLHRADAAMYRAKDRGRARVELFEDETSGAVR